MKVQFILLLLLIACFSPAAMSRGQSDGKKRKLLHQLHQYLNELQEIEAKVQQPEQAEAEEEKEYELTIVDKELTLEGFFSKNDDTVIFSVEDSDHGSGKMLLADGHGDVIFYYIRRHDNAVLVSIHNKTIFYTPSDDSLYEVSPTQFIVAHKAAEDGVQKNIDILVKQLAPMSNEEGVTYLDSLTQFATLAMNTLRALSGHGFSGRNNQAVRVFAGFARTMNMKSSAAIQSTHMNPTNNFWVQSSEATETCTSFSTTCPVGKCPGADKCSGICGPGGCECWEILCGDCCKHSACLGHTKCCRKGDFFSQLRCWVPLGFRCDDDFTC